MPLISHPWWSILIPFSPPPPSPLSPSVMHHICSAFPILSTDLRYSSQTPPCNFQISVLIHTPELLTMIGLHTYHPALLPAWVGTSWYLHLRRGRWGVRCMLPPQKWGIQRRPLLWGSQRRWFPPQ